jgi:hypothetical protein
MQLRDLGSKRVMPLGRPTSLQTARGGRSIWQHVSRLLARVVSLVPHPWRFRATCLLAYAIAPCLVMRPSLRAKRRHLARHGLISNNRPEDTALFLLLRGLTYLGIELSPNVRVNGEDILEDALSSPGVLIAGPHSDLSTLLFWLLERRSHPVVALSASELKVVCSGEPVDVLLASKTQLLKARSRLRQGATMVGYVSRTNPQEPRASMHQLQQGGVLIDDALLQVAISCGARIFFIAGYLDRSGEIVLQMGRPDPGAVTAQDHAKELARFVQEFLFTRDGKKAPGGNDR